MFLLVSFGVETLPIGVLSFLTFQDIVSVLMSSAKIEFKEVLHMELELMLVQMAQDNRSTMSWRVQNIKEVTLRSL